MLLSLALPLLLLHPVQDDRDEAWGEDLFFLVDQLEQLHPDPYHGVSREEFEEAVSVLYDRIPDLDDDQMIVELMRLFGLHSQGGKEGHCMLHPGPVFGRLPLRTYRFADGWFVVDAGGAQADLVGAQVTGVGGTPIAEVEQAIVPLMTRDNDTTLSAKLATFLFMPGLLATLGFAEDKSAIELDLVLKSGEKVQRRIAAAEPARGSGGLPRDVDVLWLSDPDAYWWMRVLEESRALYVQFNVTQGQTQDGETLAAFAAQLTRTFDEQELERVVLDVRLNGGGNNGSFGPLVQALQGHAKINRPGALHALIGRGTFSAAGNFVTVLERDTHAILVGEPTGGGPNQFGDARAVQLPHHSDLIVRISTRYHEFDPEHPDRLTHEAHVDVPFLSAEYFEGKDPVLERALTHRPR